LFVAFARRNPLAVVAIAATTLGAQTERIYVTKSSTKYHRERCRSLARSKIEMPLAQAAARYETCRTLEPVAGRYQ
jgi:hypothetical protein